MDTHDINKDLNQLWDLYCEWHPADHAGSDQFIAWLINLIEKSAVESTDYGKSLINMCIAEYRAELRARLGLPLEKPE